jgi:hypothetical protein
MARRRSARHTRPTGRRALEASHAQLEDDVSALRTQRYADHLELVRLTALVEGLVSHVQRLAIELAEMRRDLQVARTAPQQRDPAVAQLAAQVADLRATVATQQSMLSELSGRLLDVMGRLGPDPWAGHPDAAPTTAYVEVTPTPEPRSTSPDSERVTLEPTMAEMAALAREPAATSPVEPAVVRPAAGAPAPIAATSTDQAHQTDRVPATDLRDPAPRTVPDYPPPAADNHVLTLAGIPGSVSAGAAEMSRREPILAEVAASTPGYRHLAAPAPDLEELDDETVLRLRMIRESFGR